MTEFVGELETLDQFVSDLLIAPFALVAGDPFAKALHGVTERSGVELHAPLIYINRAILPLPPALPIIRGRTKTTAPSRWRRVILA
jgi:hypothetical protein